MIVSVKAVPAVGAGVDKVKRRAPAGLTVKVPVVAVAPPTPPTNEHHEEQHEEHHQTTTTGSSSSSSSPASSGGSPAPVSGATGAGVLGFKTAVVPGLSGPQSCVRSSFHVSIKSAGVTSVTFYLNGHKLKTLTARNAMVMMSCRY